MKRPGIKIIAGFLVVAVIACACGAFILIKMRSATQGAAGQTIKHFSFSSPNEINEWEEKLLAHNNTSYTVTEHAGRKCVKGDGEDSASALYYRQRLSWKRHPFVSWDWKAESFPVRKKKEALNKKAEFDFVAQVYVIFYSRFFLSTKAIQYVWTEEIPAGTVSRSPYTKNVVLIVLESGLSEEWKHEERDIEEDYRELFGEELSKDVVAVSFMTDSDSTGTTSTAYYTNIEIGYLEKPEDGIAKGGAKKSWYLRVPGIKKLFKSERKEKPSDT
ncbi:MAG: DUF3047 domain-containing protein [Candidatus Omnitrophota bacterium]